MRVREVWSGGQIGVDRAALGAARELGIPTRGWVPRGRLAEDGAVPSSYLGLRETPSEDYGERTSWNVRDSDATLILFQGALRGGSAFTRDEARRLAKPHLALDLDASPGETVRLAREWLSTLAGSRLNIAGPRASENPGIHARAREWLAAVLEPAGTAR